MKTIKGDKIKQKIIIPIIVILLFNLIMPNFSMAGFDLGGFLVSPLAGLLATIGDGINDLIYFSVSATGIKDVRPWPDGGDAAYVEGIFKDDFERKNSTYFVSGNPENKPVKEINEDDILFGYGYPNIKVTPAEIFSNKISMLDANYFKSDYKDEVGGNERSIAYKLKTTVASWYNTLRKISVVGLLSVLVYLGIRMIISSSASDQAKYKMMMKDWVVALCLIFFLHYIMAFTMTMVEEAVNIICSEARNDNETIAKQVYVTITDEDYMYEDEMLENINNNDDFLTYDENEEFKLSDYFTDAEINDILEEYNNGGNSSGVMNIINTIVEETGSEELNDLQEKAISAASSGFDNLYSSENDDVRAYVLIKLEDGTYLNANDYTYTRTRRRRRTY